MKTSPSLAAQAKAWEFFCNTRNRFCAPLATMTPLRVATDLLDQIPGTAGQPHTTIKGGGHFVQKIIPKSFAK